MRNLVLVFFLVIPVLCFSEVSFWGLVIGKTKVNEAKKNYNLTYLYNDKNSNGPTYKVDGIEYNSLKSVIATFSEKNTLVALLAFFDKGQFNNLVKSFSEQYFLEREERSANGSIQLLYTTKYTRVELANLISKNNLSVLYMDKEFYERFKKNISSNK